MCWWCGASDCRDGKKCHHAQSRNTLLNSNIYRSTNRRIERITDQRVARAPGVPWGGERPAFIPGIRDAMMRKADGICPLCRTAIDGDEAQVDHKTPWEDYVVQSAEATGWKGGALPDDFAYVMSSDPDNLQVTHARCNQRKSNSMPSRSAGSARMEKKIAQAQKLKRQKEAKEQLKLQQQAERDERARRRDRRWDDYDPDQGFGGAGILV